MAALPPPIARNAPEPMQPVVAVIPQRRKAVDDADQEIADGVGGRQQQKDQPVPSQRMTRTATTAPARNKQPCRKNPQFISDARGDHSGTPSTLMYFAT